MWKDNDERKQRGRSTGLLLVEQGRPSLVGLSWFPVKGEPLKGRALSASLIPLPGLLHSRALGLNHGSVLYSADSPLPSHGAKKQQAVETGVYTLTF